MKDNMSRMHLNIQRKNPIFTVVAKIQISDTFCFAYETNESVEVVAIERAVWDVQFDARYR